MTESAKGWGLYALSFVDELLWSPNTSTLQQFHLQQMIEYLVGQKLHELSPWISSILLQYRIEIQRSS